jgi:hypothetical protein
MIATTIIEPMFVKMVTFFQSLCILFFWNLECVVTAVVRSGKRNHPTLLTIECRHVPRCLWSLNASKEENSALSLLLFFLREKASEKIHVTSHPTSDSNVVRNFRRIINRFPLCLFALRHHERAPPAARKSTISGCRASLFLSAVSCRLHGIIR